MAGTRQWSRSKSLLLAVAVITSAASIAGLGTWARYSSSKAASPDVTAGFVTVALGATGAKTNRLTTAVTNLEPGDIFYRSFDLISSTTLMVSVTLTITDSAGAPTLSGTSDGLQLILQRCSIPWTESGSGPVFTYTCAGTTTNLVAAGNVLRTTSLSGLDALNSSATLPTTDHLMATLQLPASSPSSAQSATSTIIYTFTCIQLNTSARHR